MAKSKATSPVENIDSFLSKLEPGFSMLVQAVRETILAAHESIGEHIKWNSPAFFYTGKMAQFKATEYKRDLLVIHTRKNYALLVFPTGADIKPGHEILEGNYTDGRRMVTIKNLEELEQKKKALTAVIQQWVKLTEI